MAGYHNFSKSNNAIDAEIRGSFPISKASKIIAQKYEVSQFLAKAWLLKRGTNEYHHCSKFFNTVDYYSTKLDDEDLEDLKAFKLPEKPKDTGETGIYKIAWQEWFGFKRRSKPVRYEFEGIATVKGDWITFEKNGRLHKKRISGRNFLEIKKVS